MDRHQHIGHIGLVGRCRLHGVAIVIERRGISLVGFSILALMLLILESVFVNDYLRKINWQAALVFHRFILPV